MHITDHLQPCCVALRQQADSLPAAIHQLVELVQKSGCLTDTVQFEQDVLEREKMGGICMGRGLAIPHAKSAGVAHAELAALTLDPPLPCDTPDGEPVRLHHHLILSGAHGVQLAEVVRECWASGLADVRTLREGADFFEDTAIYLLKEDSHKGKGARRYSTSRNLTPPAEPVRLRLGEEEEAEVPPGVKIIEHVQNANEFGRYEVMVGRIYNQAAFGAWWQIQRRKAAPDPWERLRRRRQRKV